MLSTRQMLSSTSRFSEELEETFINLRKPGTEHFSKLSSLLSFYLHMLQTTFYTLPAYQGLFRYTLV